jgi:hypothetical protein
LENCNFAEQNERVVIILSGFENLGGGGGGKSGFKDSQPSTRPAKTGFRDYRNGIEVLWLLLLIL